MQSENRWNQGALDALSASGVCCVGIPGDGYEQSLNAAKLVEKQELSVRTLSADQADDWLRCERNSEADAGQIEAFLERVRESQLLSDAEKERILSAAEGNNLLQMTFVQAVRQNVRARIVSAANRYFAQISAHRYRLIQTENQMEILDLYSAQSVFYSQAGINERLMAAVSASLALWEQEHCEEFRIFPCILEAKRFSGASDAVNAQIRSFFYCLAKQNG